MKTYEIKPIGIVKRGSLVRVPTISGYEYVIVGRNRYTYLTRYHVDNSIFRDKLIECHSKQNRELILIPSGLHVEVIRDTEYSDRKYHE